jgi:phosphonate transport system permease protein
LIGSRRGRLIAISVAVVYMVAALSSVEVDWSRVVAGLDRGAAFAVAFAHPDFVSHWTDIRAGLIESLTMTVVSTIIGILVSIPVALYYCCRAFIAATRSFQEIIIAILLVAMFGFGPFAGMLTLSIATVGFFAKLLAEDIESMDPLPAEAIESTGASWLQWVNYAITPQVMPRIIGLSLYRLDINFRESAVVGIVGAGGIGATLNTAFDRYEFDTAAAILIVIIAIVMVAEYTSGYVRSWVQ